MKYILFLFLFILSTQVLGQPPVIMEGVLRGETFKYDCTPTDPPIFTSPPPDDHERVVYWLHGLGGQADFWNPVANHYKAKYDIHAPTPTFGDTGIDNAAFDLENEMIDEDFYNFQNDINPTQNIIVSQSMGGLVARQVDKRTAEIFGEDERRFGGLISFAGPHQGAQILNNVDLEGPAMANEFAKNAFIALTEGPLELVEAQIATALKDVVPLSAKIFSFAINPLLGIGINAIDNALNNFANSLDFTGLITGVAGGLDLAIPLLFADFQGNNAQDHRVDSDFMTQLNQYETTIPMVAIYSLEVDPVFWRVISSFTEDVPHEFPAFQATDETWIDNSNDMLLDYVAKRNLYASNPGGMSGSDAMEVSIGYAEGVDWLLKANDLWEFIIGRQYARISYNCVCEQWVMGEFFEYSYPAYTDAIDTNPFDDNDNTDCNFTYQGTTYSTCSEAVVTNVSFVKVGEGSDGVVLAHSAKELPGRVTEIEVTEANHQEIRNHWQTEKVLDDLFEENLIFNSSDFFKLEER
ncbi:MAG: pimeloyl-ACP methyl ester carboxylesterase [Saprospiraceae bacterium]|jgi:pimeloyl-ACP methyl ester carboxylesterase